MLIKIEKDDFSDDFLVMTGGNPYHQVYRGTFQNCLVIVSAYETVGYKLDVADSKWK